MIKLAMSGSGLAPLAVIGLVAFVAIFAGVIVWTLTRRRSEVDTWSSLPLADGTDPVQPRHGDAPAERNEHDAHRHDGHRDGGHGDGGSCGKCDVCTCVTATDDGLPIVTDVVTTVSIN